MARHFLGFSHAAIRSRLRGSFVGCMIVFAAPIDSARILFSKFFTNLAALTRVAKQLMEEKL